MKSILTLGLLLFAITSFGTTNNPYFRFPEKSKIEHFTSGSINWTEGYFLARAKGSLNLKNKNATHERLRIEKELVEQAKQNLLNIILETRIDSYNYVRDYFNKSEQFKILFLDEIRKNIITFPPVYIGSGQIEAAVKYPLYGKGSLADLIFQLDDNVEAMPEMRESRYHDPVAYSSIIIDLRHRFKLRFEVSERLEKLPVRLEFPGYLRQRIRYDAEETLLFFKGKMLIQEKEALLSLSNDKEYREAVEELYKKSLENEKEIQYIPSLFPSIYDSEGKLVYSKDMVDLPLRSAIQYAKYTKNHLLFYKIELVGKNPLYILADKIKGENNTNIVINQEDRTKIFLNPKTVENLKKGKIFLLVD